MAGVDGYFIACIAKDRHESKIGNIVYSQGGALTSMNYKKNQSRIIVGKADNITHSIEGQRRQARFTLITSFVQFQAQQEWMILATDYNASKLRLVFRENLTTKALLVGNCSTKMNKQDICNPLDLAISPGDNTKVLTIFLTQHGKSFYTILVLDLNTFHFRLIGTNNYEFAPVSLAVANADTVLIGTERSIYNITSNASITELRDNYNPIVPFDYGAIRCMLIVDEKSIFIASTINFGMIDLNSQHYINISSINDRLNPVPASIIQLENDTFLLAHGNQLSTLTLTGKFIQNSILHSNTVRF